MKITPMSTLFVIILVTLFAVALGLGRSGMIGQGIFY